MRLQSCLWSNLPYLKQQILRQRSKEMRQVVSRDPMPNTKPWMPYQRHPVSPNTQAWHRLTEGREKGLIDYHLLSLTNDCWSVRAIVPKLMPGCLLVDSCTWKWWKMAPPRGWSQNRRQPGWWSWALEVWASFFSYNRLTTLCHSPTLMRYLQAET